MTNYAIRKQKFCLKRDESLRMGFCRKDPSIEDVFVSYKLEKKKKKQTPFPPSTHPPPKLKRNPRQPRSQGSLPPTLRSARENLGTGLKPRKMYFFSFTTLDARVIKTNFKAMKKKKKKKILAIFFTSTQPCQDQNKNRIQECWFFFLVYC